MEKSATYRGYVIATYVTFWLMVLVICGSASMIFHAPPIVMRILSNVCAWSPTIVLLVMFKKLRPHESRKEFFKTAFSGKIKAIMLFLPPIILGTASILSVWLISVFEGKSFTSMFSVGSYSLGITLILSLLSGPTGEEAGWRGFLRAELAKKYSFLKASVIQGIIWSFWHTVLWFVDSEFSGVELIPYVASNVIVMTCIAIVMNVVLEKSNNLLYAILLHFSFNFTYCFIRADIWFYVVLSLVYIMIAIGFLIYRKHFSINEVSSSCSMTGNA